jgi:hypothetical protein
MTTMKQIEKKMAQTLTNATGIKVTVEYVSAKQAYFFIEWEGKEPKVSETINKCFGGKCQDFDYDDEFNFSSCYVNL